MLMNCLITHTRYLMFEEKQATSEKCEIKRLYSQQSLKVATVMCSCSSSFIFCSPLTLNWCLFLPYFLCNSDVIWIFHRVFVTWYFVDSICIMTNNEPEPICCSILILLNLFFYSGLLSLWLSWAGIKLVLWTHLTH